MNVIGTTNKIGVWTVDLMIVLNQYKFPECHHCAMDMLKKKVIFSKYKLKCLGVKGKCLLFARKRLKIKSIRREREDMRKQVGQND